MADSSSKEAFRALGAFLAAYMQGKQNEKDRASKDHWEQVHYELAKQQLEVSEKNAAASSAMQKARFDMDKQQFDAQKMMQEQSLGRQMQAAQSMGAASPEEFDMRLKKQNADAMTAYREGGGFGGDKGQFTALSTAIDDSRYEMGQVQSRMSSLQKLMSDPMTDDATKQAAIAELAQLDTRYKSLDVEMTNLKARRANMMGLGAAPSQQQDDSISRSGAAQMPKETTKQPEKSSSWPKNAQGKPKRLEELDSAESVGILAGVVAKPVVKGSESINKKMGTMFKGLSKGLGTQYGPVFNSPLPGGGMVTNTGINPEKLKEFLGTFNGGTPQPRSIWEGMYGK